MGIENAFLFIIFPVDLQKVRAKIVDDGFVVVGSIAVGCDAARDGVYEYRVAK
jgi:hypothetical protein